MPKVHLLEDELINKIAAGEVVERPASVIKELVENCVDAGASQVEVELLDGGKSLISVRDNGGGMSREDALLSIRRHCTSKINSLDDLFQIGTMGFRGEALASISAVSKFTMVTRSGDSDVGTKLSFVDGELEVQDWNGDVGTQITIKDIFHNVPARKNFLKSNSAEFAQCNELMQSLALSLPDVGFVLKHNGREHMRVEPVDVVSDEMIGAKAMEKRVLDVLPIKDLRLCYLNQSNKYGTVEAMISPPGFEKSTGKHIFMFVNGRWVKDKNVRYSILRGYHSHLLKGRFPVCIVHLNMDPSLVDVNVHPNKSEVRFQYAQEVQSLIAIGIRDRLREGDWASSTSTTLPSTPSMPPVSPRPSSFPSSSRPSLSPAMSRSGASTSAPKAKLPSERDIFEAKPASNSFGTSSKGYVPDFDLSFKSPVAKESSARELQESKASPAKSFSSSSHVTSKKPYMPGDKKTTVISFEQDRGGQDLSAPIQMDFNESAPAPEKTAIENPLPWADMEFLGAFSRCYLFFSHFDQLVVVDQHAFHERILYERLKRDRSILKQVQPLLMPEVIQLSPSEISSLKSKVSFLKDLGIEVSIISDSEAEVAAVPSVLKKANLEGLLSQFANGVTIGDDMEEGAVLAHDVLSTMACHSAVRAGEELPPAELDYLLSEANDVDFYHNCPHGRPVVKLWKKSQVEGWFER